MRKVKSQKLLLILTIVSGVLFLAGVAVNVVLQATKISDEYPAVEISISILLPTLMAIFVVFFTRMQEWQGGPTCCR